MDVHVFRRFCDALCPLLTGARLEKIQSPLENVFVFTFYTAKQKQHLVLKSGRRDAFCYLAKERPVTDAPPPALIMRWRKYCSGRRILSCTADWLGRKILLLFQTNTAQSPQNPQETWLILDLRTGPQLLLGKSPQLDFMQTPLQWPDALHLADACENWQVWPMLSPALRRHLATLDTEEGAALLMDLELGGGDMYVYEDIEESTEKTMPVISAWPLARTHTRTERVFEDPLPAAAHVGDALVLGVGEEKLRNKAALPHERELARLKRLLQKLNVDEERLLNMQKAQELGLILQAELWKYPAKYKKSSIVTDHAQYERIELDATLTLQENMQALFHKAGRGRRGLEYLQNRRKEIEEQIYTLHTLALTVKAGANTSNKKTLNTKRNAQTAVNTQSKGASALPKGVQAFKSSDGFIILRGKDAKGNGAALRAASAKDIWLHVEGGPGSHCIIRRHFTGQEIPMRTLEEAASLAAVKSWQKDSPTAHILCAEVRHVKPMRGAATGTVRIDKALQSFTVSIDYEAEQKLNISVR